MEELFMHLDDDDIIQIDAAPWWSPGEYIVVKREILVEDEEWVQNRIVKMKKAEEQEEETRRPKKQVTAAPSMELEALLGSTKRLMLERMIVHGKLLNRRGQPLLFETPEQRAKSVRKLNKQNSDYIYELINEMNQPLEEQEKKASLNGANPGISEIPAIAHKKSS